MNYAEILRFENTGYGAVRYIGTANVIPVGDQQTILFVAVDGLDPQPLVGWYYERASNTFSATVFPGMIVPRRTLLASELWFKSFTTDERSIVWALCAGATVPNVTITLLQRYRLASFRDMTLAGEPIPLHATETETVINALETIGALAPGRANEILEK